MSLLVYPEGERTATLGRDANPIKDAGGITLRAYILDGGWCTVAEPPATLDPVAVVDGTQASVFISKDIVGAGLR